MSDPGEMALAFQADWQRLHGAALPVGYVLRDTSTPWIRFHALPGSKRYAQTEAEHANILARGNRLAREVLDEDSECWLVLCAYPGIDLPPYLWGGAEIWPVMRFCLNEDTEEWQAWALLTTWQDSKFDALLEEVAADLMSYALWMNRNNGAIFAPYDGGFDLFPTPHADVEELRRRFWDWLPSTPEGL